MIEYVVTALVASVTGNTGEIVYQSIKRLLRDKLEQDEIAFLDEDSPNEVTQSELENLQKVLHSVEVREGVETSARSSSDAITIAIKSASALRDERKKQASWSFVAALSLCIIGVVVIFTGVILLIFQQNYASGGIATAAGIVSEVLAAGMFKLYNNTNDRLDKVIADVHTLEKAQIGIETAANIENANLRDKTLSKLAQNLHSHSIEKV